MLNITLKQFITYFLIGCGVIIAISIFSWLFGNGRLSVTLPEDAHTVIIRQQDNTEEPQPEEVTGGETITRILPTGKYEVSVFNEDKQKATSYFLDIPRFLGTTHKDTTLVNQADRQKIGRGGRPCQTFIGSDLYSSTCSGASTLSAVPTLSLSRSLDTNEIDIPDIISAQSYKNGALVLHTITYQDEELIIPKLSYVEGGEVKQTVDLPEALNNPTDQSLRYQLSISGDNFIISGSYGELAFYFTDVTSEPRRLDFDLVTGDFLLEQLISVVNMRDDIVTIVTGIPDQGHGTTDDGASRPATVFVNSFSIANDSIETIHSSALNDTAFEDAHLCGDGHVCVANESLMQLHKLEDSKTSLIATVPNVDGQTIPVSDTQFAYQQEDGVFLFDIEYNEARQIYRSPNFRISSITPSSQGIILTAFPEKEGSDSAFDLYSFLLTHDIADSNTFADEKLPYVQGSVDGAVLMSDYYRSTILVKVALDSWESPVRASGGGARDYTYSQDEFNEKRDRILRQLAEDGFTPEDYTIRIEP